MSKSVTRTLALDPAPAPELEGDIVYFEDEHAPLASEADAELCPICHDPLAWHEHACHVPQAPLLTQPEATLECSPPQPGSSFAFAIGHRVQPLASSPAVITWRGQHKERHPATGLVHRINVYCLDNGYWDCYREDELQAA